MKTRQPNQALEPTPIAVTDPAAQASRQLRSWLIFNVRQNNMYRIIVCIIPVALALLVAGCSSTLTKRAVEDKPPTAIHLSPPQYPLELKKAGITGKVVVELLISTSGDVIEAHAVEATHPLFADAAVAAMLQCKYTPGIKNGVAVNTKLRVPLSFDLQ